MLELEIVWGVILAVGLIALTTAIIQANRPATSTALGRRHNPSSPRATLSELPPADRLVEALVAVLRRLQTLDQHRDDLVLRERLPHAPRTHPLHSSLSRPNGDAAVLQC